MARLEQQCVKEGQTIGLGEPVLDLEREDDPTRLRISGGKHLTRAAGLVAFRPRCLGVPGGRAADPRRRLLRGIARIAGRRTLIVGGGDSDLDWANTLAPIADVRFVHNLFKGHEESIVRMQNFGIQYGQPWELRCIEGDARVQEAVIGPVGSDASERIAVDEVLICVGFSIELGSVKNWGLPIRGGQI